MTFRTYCMPQCISQTVMIATTVQFYQRAIQLDAIVVLGRIFVWCSTRDLLGHIEQQWLPQTVILTSIEERIDFKLVAEFL